MNNTSMPTALIKQMTKDYKDNQRVAIQNGTGLNDAMSGWFDLKSLKNFIQKIEAEVKNVNPNIDENDLGIRIYYSAYPRGAKWTNSEFPEINELHNNPITNQYQGLHTMVMIPTLKRMNNGVSVLVDFNPKDPSSYTINNNHCLNNPEFMAMNHGSLFPPFDLIHCLF